MARLFRDSKTQRSRPAAAGWFETRLPLGALYRWVWRDYPVPANLKLTWTFGILVATALAVLTLSGIGLEFSDGWLLGDLHRDGATMLFGVVFIELVRGIAYGSYRNRRELAWIIEIVRFFLFLALGLLGIARAGRAAAAASGLSVASLRNLGQAHEMIGFLVLPIAALGFLASRMAPPANPDGIVALLPRDLEPQLPTYAGRILTSLILFGLIFGGIVIFAPHLGADRTGRTLPWYLLGVGGLVRTGTAIGVPPWLTVAAALALLAGLPWLDRGRVASRRYRPLYGGFVWVLEIDWILLSIAAAKPATGPWPTVVAVTSGYFFLHFLVLTPLITTLEPTHAVPLSITQRTV